MSITFTVRVYLGIRICMHTNTHMQAYGKKIDEENQIREKEQQRAFNGKKIRKN